MTEQNCGSSRRGRREYNQPIATGIARRTCQRCYRASTVAAHRTARYCDASVFITGNQLLVRCQSDGMADKSFCLGFVVGVSDSLGMIQAMRKMNSGGTSVWRLAAVSFPDGVEAVQIRDIAVSSSRTTRRIERIRCLLGCACLDGGVGLSREMKTRRCWWARLGTSVIMRIEFLNPIAAKSANPAVHRTPARTSS
jgi:hypothetical protein